MLAAARYIEQNLVWAGLAAAPWEYPWSSAAAYVAGQDDGLVTVTPLLAQVRDWKEFLSTPVTEGHVRELHRHERSGRPVGNEPLVLAVERTLGRTLRLGRPGPKRRQSA